RPRAIRILLSNHFARFLMVPWDPSLSGEEERREYLRHHFAEVYGEQTTGWSFLVDRRGDGDARLALAVDAELVAEALALAARRSVRPAGMEPLMTAEFNRFRAQLPQATLCFAVLEPGRVSALLVRDGRVERVASQRSLDPAAEVEAVVAIERLEAG